MLFINNKILSVYTYVYIYILFDTMFIKQLLSIIATVITFINNYGRKKYKDRKYNYINFLILRF